MAALVSDELWSEIEALIPKRRISPKGGRPAVDDRKALTGIVFVLKSGVPWRMLPLEMGCGSGVTCWRRLHTWTKAGVWPAIHAKLLRVLGKAGRIDASHVVVDSASVRALFGGFTPDQIPQIGPRKAARGMCSRTPMACRS
jgi:transposase